MVAAEENPKGSSCRWCIKKPVPWFAIHCGSPECIKKQVRANNLAAVGIIEDEEKHAAPKKP